MVLYVSVLDRLADGLDTTGTNCKNRPRGDVADVFREELSIPLDFQ